MKAINILKKIKNQEWWIEETPANHQVAEWAWRGFIESSRYFMKGLLSFSVFLYKNGFVSEVTPRDQKIKQFYFALKKYKKDKKYLGKKLVNYEKAVKNLEIAGWKMIGEYDKLTKKELAFLYEKFIANYVEQARYSIFVECVDPFTEDILPEILRKTVLIFLLLKVKDRQFGCIFMALRIKKLSKLVEKQIYFLQLLRNLLQQML